MSVTVDKDHIKSLEKADDVIDQIYNDHEAQLKLASDVYSTDKMHMYQELKAKDDEIRRLNNLYADTIKDLGEVLMEIERLKKLVNSMNNTYSVGDFDFESYYAITNNFECAIREIDRLKEQKHNG